MALGKQAKVLSRSQLNGALGYVAKTRYPKRNQVIFLLSHKAGLRAKEIASVTWSMLTSPDGEVGRAIELRNSASKGKSGRMIPLNARATRCTDTVTRGRAENIVPLLTSLRLNGRR